MKTVTDSPEYDFVKFLEKINYRRDDWSALYFGLSRAVDHDYLMDNLPNLKTILDEYSRKFEDLYSTIQEMCSAAKADAIYKFTDHDILVMVKIKNADQSLQFQDIFSQLSNKLTVAKCTYTHVSDDYNNLVKLSDKKILSMKKMEAYRELTDFNKVSSIGLRRSKRFEPRVMIVEDDRFTAAYTSNLLNRDFEVIHARNGEEAIRYYIEYAPDTVFLDIHLPGMTGHQTLKALRAVDSKAFIVMMSVDTIRENVMAACKLGAQSFLKKPFNKDRLLKVARKSPFLSAQSNQHEDGQQVLGA